MNKRTMDRETANLEQVHILKTVGYRGYRAKKRYEKLEYSIEVTAFNKNGLRLIGSGSTLDKAYENLIIRIDMTLDG